jgi:eukaryotic-like serine/threonine-protein kinase
MAAPRMQQPASFAPAGYPPPSHAAPPSPYGSTQPQFAPKVRIRKTPEMLGFRAVDTLGTIVAALFATWIPLSIYSVVLSLDQRRLIQKYGSDIPFAQQNSLDGRFGMVHAFAGVLVLIVVPLFLIWFARAYGNLPTISPGKTQSRTTVATLMWFVPFLQFVRPLGYLKEIWSRTDRVDKAKPAPPTLIFVYWFSFLALQVLQVLIVFGALNGRKNPDDLRFAADLNVLGAATGVVCATLIGVIVWVVTRRMTARCAEVTNAVLNAPQYP